MATCRFRSISETNAPIVRAILIFMLQYTVIGENCNDILCSHVFDYVCAMTESSNGIRALIKFQNICYLQKTRCHLKYIADIHQVPEKLCKIDTLLYNSRRVNDFGIVGAHQACNHTCPTFCTDTYNPACAQIWKRNMQSYSYRPMINHCHIDLFSCAVGVNVTIQPLGKCYKNPSGLLFMSQIAAMKSLKLLDDAPVEHRINKYPLAITSNRKSNIDLLEEPKNVISSIEKNNNMSAYT